MATIKKISKIKQARTKRLQSRRKPNEDAQKQLIVKIARVSLVLLFLFVVAVIIYYFRAQFLALEEIKFSSDHNDELLEADRHSSFKKNEVFTLLMINDQNDDSKNQVDGFLLIRLDSNEKTATVITFHPEIFIRQNGFAGVGTVQTDSELIRVKDLMIAGEISNPPVPLAYAFYQIQEQFAISVDGYMFWKSDEILSITDLCVGMEPPRSKLNGKSYDEWADDWNEYWIKFFRSVSLIKVYNFRGEIPQINSNMKTGELFEFIANFKSIDEDDINFVTFGEEDLTEVVNEKGDIVNLLTTGEIDEVLTEEIVDTQMQREQARVEIFNGSGINGLGSRYTRWISHLGADVIRVENAPGEWSESVLYVTDKDKFEYSLLRIEGLWEEGISVVEGRPDFVTTGDIIVVLGSDAV